MASNGLSFENFATCAQLWIATLLIRLARKHVCLGHGYANRVVGHCVQPLA